MLDIKSFASGSTGNCYRVSDGSTSLLIEAGIPFKKILACCNFKLSEFDGCIISHCHGDHAKSASDLAKHGIDIYASQGTIDSSSLKDSPSKHRIKPITALKQFHIGTFAILPFDVEHDVPEPLGFVIESKTTHEKLLYFTDTYYLRYSFTGLTHIMAEANYSENTVHRTENINRLMESHMSLETLIDMLKSNDLSDLQQIYLIHLSNDNSDETAFKTAIQQATGAETIVC